MRAAKTVFMIWLLCELALWIRGGQGFSVFEALPIVQRNHTISPEYDWLALAALMIGLWGYLMITPTRSRMIGKNGDLGRARAWRRPQ